MLKLILLFVSLTSFLSFAQNACVYCTSMVDALVNPERVEVLDLSAQGISALPKEINQLGGLKILDLSENAILSIDFKLVSLPFLEELDLANNPGFNTIDLTKIGDALPRLKNVNLSNCNALTVSPSIAKCSEIEYLNLSNNSIILLPSEFDELKKLRHLDVSSNRLKTGGFLPNLWALEYLDLSGNEELDLRDVGTSLYFKANLKELILTPTDQFKYGLPDVFEQIYVEHLTLKNGSMSQLSGKLSRNDSLNVLTLDNMDIEEPKKFTSWINRMTNLEVLEYKNMTVPMLLDQIVSVDKMIFVHCSFGDYTELKKVKPRVQMIAFGTNITFDGYIGNSKLIYGENQIAAAQPIETVKMSDAMLSNEVTAIVTPQVQNLLVKGDEPSVVATKSTQFEIPSNAFLDASGEVYSGEVKIEVVEYMNPIVNALAGAPMVFQTEGGNELFASSGMIDFRAYTTSGEELQPNPEQIIQVQMNDLQPAADANYYSFNEETMNWDVEPLPRPSNFLEQKQALLDSLSQAGALVSGIEVLPIALLLNHKKSRLDPHLLSFEAKGRKVQLRRIQGNTDKIFTSNPEQRWIAKGKTWKIDTIVTKEMLDLFAAVKKDQRQVEKLYRKKAISRLEFAPRVLRDLTISPNLARDNYDLSFVHRGETHRIPVVLSLSGSISKIQRKEKTGFNSFQKAQRVGDKERKVIDKFKQKELEEFGELRRFQVGGMLSVFPDDAQTNKEYIRFGLTSFGMVNCDYFSRNVPDGYLAFDSIAIDKDGNSVPVPRDVRNIYLDDNSYVSTTSIDVPVYKNRKSIILFLISAVEIGIVKGWEILKNGVVRPKVERVSIEGLTPEEVSRKILDAGS